MALLSATEIIEIAVRLEENGEAFYTGAAAKATTPGVKALQDIVKKARRSGAGIVKIATLVKGAEDLRKLAKILSEFNGLIVIGMGGPGACSRVFFPMLGSLITYGSIDRPTAPGQIALKEIKKEFGRYGFQRPRS